MLEKLQGISSRLDKKRLYTAIGALVVALAAGHVMQSRVLQPQGIAQAPVQPPLQQSMLPVDGTDTAVLVLPTASEPDVVPEAEVDPEIAAAPEVAPAPEVAVDDVAVVEGVTADAPVEVTSADNTPANAPVLSAEITEEAAPVEAPVTEPAPDMLAMLETPETPEPTLPEMEQEPVLMADLSTAAVDETLPMPRLEDPAFDAKPAGVVPTPDPLATSGACAPALTLLAMPGAMIHVDYIAPCDASEEVEFDHAGLRFTEQLDDQGMLTVMVPAFTADAVVTVENEARGDTRSAEVLIPDMAAYDRVALIWQGGTGLQLHALENGAYYGDEGHLWAEDPGMPTNATEGQGGFVTVLGSVTGGYAADVYTYPLSMAVPPAISIEAQVLNSTCDGAITGVYLHATPTGSPVETLVGMNVPGCETVGEYLVLKNLPRDLTIAGN